MAHLSTAVEARAGGAVRPRESTKASRCMVALGFARKPQRRETIGSSFGRVFLGCVLSIIASDCSSAGTGHGIDTNSTCAYYGGYCSGDTGFWSYSITDAQSCQHALSCTYLEYHQNEACRRRLLDWARCIDGVSSPEMCGACEAILSDIQSNCPEPTKCQSVQCSNPLATRATGIATGASHTCALMQNAGVRCWGANGHGQLGDGTTEDRAHPESSDLLLGVQSVAVGMEHSCVLTKTTGVRCWGSNAKGQLGIEGEQDCTTPPDSDTINDVKDLATGNHHTCVLNRLGGVRCWGDNSSGQLGDDSTDDRSTPPDTNVLDGVKAIAAGDNHTCALMTAGGVRCWGDNSSGQLGDGTTESRSTPPDSDVFSGAMAIAAGNQRTCAITESGGVRCWGKNSRGQLGDGTTEDRSTPPDADVLTGVQAIAIGGDHTCAIMETGGVRCWGENTKGELGDGTVSTRSVPPASDASTQAKAIAIGGSGAGDTDYPGYTCVVTTAGGVRCWGANANGQLGDGTETDRRTPTSVLGICD